MNIQPTLPAPGMEHPHAPTMLVQAGGAVVVWCCGHVVAEGRVSERDELAALAASKGHRGARG